MLLLLMLTYHSRASVKQSAERKEHSIDWRRSFHVNSVGKTAAHERSEAEHSFCMMGEGGGGGGLGEESRRPRGLVLKRRELLAAMHVHSKLCFQLPTYKTDDGQRSIARHCVHRKWVEGLKGVACGKCGALARIGWKSICTVGSRISTH